MASKMGSKQTSSEEKEGKKRKGGLSATESWSRRGGIERPPSKESWREKEMGGLIDDGIAASKRREQATPNRGERERVIEPSKALKLSNQGGEIL